MIELRPRPYQGPLGLRRPTRLVFEDGALVIYDVRKKRLPLPGARVLVPYASRGRKMSQGLMVLDDAGRVMAGMDADFDPYEVAAFAKEYGFNMRTQDLASRGELMQRFSPAPQFHIVDAYSTRVLWELFAVVLLIGVAVWGGQRFGGWFAQVVGGDSDSRRVTAELAGMALGVLVALKIGPALAFVVRAFRSR